jgi:hypothetical protein
LSVNEFDVALYAKRTVAENSDFSRHVLIG